MPRPHRGRSAPADQPDYSGQERQRPLSVRREQALCGQDPLEPLEPGQQLTQPDLADLVGTQAQRAPRRIELGLGVQRDPGALGQLGRPGIEDVAVGGDGEAEVGRRVAQGQEHHGGTGPAADLRHLLRYKRNFRKIMRLAEFGDSRGASHQGMESPVFHRRRSADTAIPYCR